MDMLRCQAWTGQAATPWGPMPVAMGRWFGRSRAAEEPAEPIMPAPLLPSLPIEEAPADVF